MAAPEEPQAPAPPPSPKRELSQQMASTIGAFVKDSEQLNQPEERIELDEIPDHIKEEKAEEEKKRTPPSSVVYSYGVYDNPDVRAEVEARCEELGDFSDLLLTGRVVQEVPILEDKIEVTYQSLIADETWFAHRASIRKFTDRREVQTWNGYARLALSIKSVNSHEYIPAVDQKGNLDEKLLDERVEAMLQLPEHFISIMLVNLNWFEDRVQQLFSNDYELLKNG